MTLRTEPNTFIVARARSLHACAPAYVSSAARRGVGVWPPRIPMQVSSSANSGRLDTYTAPYRYALCNLPIHHYEAGV